MLMLLTGVKTSCTLGQLVVSVDTGRPFHGAVYARGYPNKCRASGKGNTTTVLTVESQQCGVKITEDEVCILIDIRIYVEYYHYYVYV